MKLRLAGGGGEVPPGGWRVRESDDALVEGRSWPELVDNVLAYRRANGLPIPPGVERDIMDALCRALPPGSAGLVVPAEPIPTPGQRSVDTMDVVRFVKTMALWLGQGLGFVEQAEAERRAEICVGCRFQAEAVGGCGSCVGLASLVMGVASGRSTRLDNSLLNCGFCGCANRVAVHFPLGALTRASGEIAYPADTDGAGTPCWRLGP